MTALESYEREREEFENTLFRPNMEHSTDPNLLDRFQRNLADNTLQSLDPAIQALEMPFLPRGVQTGNSRTNLEVCLVWSLSLVPVVYSNFNDGCWWYSGAHRQLLVLAFGGRVLLVRCMWKSLRSCSSRSTRKNASACARHSTQSREYIVFDTAETGIDSRCAWVFSA